MVKTASQFDSDSLNDWLSWLETLHPKTIELGLDRIRCVADKLNLFSELQQLKPRIVTIAGTNGKGTCVAALQAFLLEAGKTVGAYTSPHLLRYNERVVINGSQVTDRQLVDAFKCIESVRGDISLSYFEYGTLATFLLFLQAQLDYWLLEVGLGGRLDAVNLLDADIAIVTSIDLDHQDWLGDDREKIGFEKAGIYRTQRPAICVDLKPPMSLIEHARKITAQLFLADRNIVWQTQPKTWQWQGQDTKGRQIVCDNLPLTQLPLSSISAALQALHLLEVSLDDLQIRRLLSALQLPGRCQQIEQGDRQFIFDVAHNPAAAQYLGNKLQAVESGRPINTVAVFAVMADKDVRSMVDALSDNISHWYLAGLPGNSRAASEQKLTSVFRDLPLTYQYCDTVIRAIHTAIANTQPGDRIVVFGSFYTVAEGLEWLHSQATSEVNHG